MVKRRKTLFYNFNDKHLEYIRTCLNSAYNIAEGSIRSGKTTDNVFAFAHDIKHSKDKIHLATASTQPTAKLIIGDCDGFGLEHIFRGQCRWGRYKGNECLIIRGPDTGYREKVVLFCGGAKADSYKKFRGTTIGIWIATEIDLHHENTIDEALKRQIKAHTKRLYWDLNPSSPHAAIYTKYIDDWQKKADAGTLLGGYNYRQFNIFDNPNIPPQNLKEVLSRYDDKGSVYYIRDILGERCVAEGLIYRRFAENINDYLIEQKDLPKLEYINIGVDFGGNKSNHAFVATGLDKDYNKVCVLRSKSIPAPDTDVDFIVAQFQRFADGIKRDYGFVDRVYVDSAEQSIKNTMYHKTDYTIVNSIKNKIISRIRTENRLISEKRLLLVDGENEALINGLKNAVYDEKKLDDTRLDDGTSDIDILDAFEYSWEFRMKQLLRE